jgi:hypothetical protein
MINSILFTNMVGTGLAMYMYSHYDINFTCQGEFVAQWVRLGKINVGSNLTKYSGSLTH